MAGDYKLVDLTCVPDETFQKQYWIGMLGLFMKYAHERNVLKIFEKAKAIIRFIAGDDKNFDYIQLFLRYISSRVDKKERTKLFHYLHNNIGEKGDKLMTTLAQHWIEEGMEKGMEKGIEKGAINNSILVAKKSLEIGLDFKTISRITGLDEEQIRKLQD